MAMPKSVSNWEPKKPSGKRPELLEPNARDNPDTLAPESPLKQAVGKSGKPSGPFGKAGREF
jgi:hypothetical protein